MKRRARFFCFVGGLVFVGLALLWLSSDTNEAGNQVAFRLEIVRQIRNGPTNIVAFRLTALSSQKTYLLAGPGTISVPTSGNRLVLLGDGDPAPLYGPWAWYPLHPARCITNFVPLTFKTHTEFAIFAPTNEIWRLNVQPLLVLSR